MTTMGRADVPIQPSRYTPFAALFSIALIFAFSIIIKDNKTKP
jgi:hypothetical protein